MADRTPKDTSRQGMHHRHEFAWRLRSGAACDARREARGGKRGGGHSHWSDVPIGVFAYGRLDGSAFQRGGASGQGSADRVPLARAAEHHDRIRADRGGAVQLYVRSHNERVATFWAGTAVAGVSVCRVVDVATLLPA